MTSTFFSVTKSCTKFLCNDGGCIDQIYVCDKHPDCYDQSDESNCNHGDDKDSGSNQLHGQYVELYSNIVVMVKILVVNSHICIIGCIYWPSMSFLLPHRGVIVSILNSSVVDHGFPSDKTKDYEIGTDYQWAFFYHIVELLKCGRSWVTKTTKLVFSASPLNTTSGLRAKTDGSESEWNDMFTHVLSFQWACTIYKNPTEHVGLGTLSGHHNYHSHLVMLLLNNFLFCFKPQALALSHNDMF
jgi:hypothetical protein